MLKPGEDVILLPGLGADGRMFEAQRDHLGHVVTPTWIDPVAGETLPEYAARMAEQLPQRPAVLGGASFGGMVAQELAKHLEPGCVVLIGSATPHCLPRPLRRLGRMVRHIPPKAFDQMLRASPLAARPMGVKRTEDIELFLRMAGETSPRFMHWACGAIAKWEAGRVDDVPILRIHGRSDRVLPPPRGLIHHLVDGAGHLLSMTHPEEVNGFLEQALLAYGRSDAAPA